MARKRYTFETSYQARRNSTVLDQQGRAVGTVLSCYRLDDSEPPSWNVEIEAEDGTDIDSIQILQPYGVTGSINA